MQTTYNLLSVLATSVAGAPRDPPTSRIWCPYTFTTRVSPRLVTRRLPASSPYRCTWPCSHKGGLYRSMSGRKASKPAWHGSSRSPSPQGGACVTKTSGLLRPLIAARAIFAESVYARRRIAFSVYWFDPPEYQRDPERPARVRLPVLTTRPSRGSQPSGAFASWAGSWFPRT